MRTLGSFGGAQGRVAYIAAINFAGGAACVSLLSVLIVKSAAVGPAYAAFSLGVYTAFVMVMIAAAPGLRLPAGGFGVANQITLARAVLISLIGGLLAPTAPGGYLTAWAVVIVALAALLLDGVDGWLARRFHRMSSFGARFDMETDALLALILAVLVVRFDKAGTWILAAGGARYVFGLAGLLLPQLRRPLPASRRRQTVCVVLVATLTLCMVPSVATGWTQALAAIALATVLWSFGTDVAWLVRPAGRPGDRIERLTPSATQSSPAPVRDQMSDLSH